MLGEALAIGVLGVFFLQVARIGKQQLAQVKGGGGRVDFAVKPLVDEARNVAGVVKVGMGQHQPLDALR